MGMGYFEIHVPEQAVLINWTWKGSGEGQGGGGGCDFTLSFIASHIKHFQVLYTGLATKKLQMGDTSDWDHFENVQGSQDWS